MFRSTREHIFCIYIICVDDATSKSMFFNKHKSSGSLTFSGRPGDELQSSRYADYKYICLVKIYLSLNLNLVS